MPKIIHKNSIIGQMGVNLIEQIVLQMGFLWYSTGGIEAGIDGTIEIRNPITGEVSNNIIQVQSKATARSFKAETETSFEYTCDAKDIFYWLSGNTPVIIVVSRPKDKLAYWVSLKEYFDSEDKIKSKKIKFNKEINSFTHDSAPKLIKLIEAKQPSSYHADHERNFRRDWGDAPDIENFFGRKTELETLKQWILVDHCRIIAVVGMAGVGKTRLSVKLGKGGIGKTDLTAKLTREIHAQFDYIFWRRLLNAPPLLDILRELLDLITDSSNSTYWGDNVDEVLGKVINALRSKKCLIILDNLEALLQEGGLFGEFREGYAQYGDFLREVGQVPHRSCMILTSREKPKDIALIEGKSKPVRSFELRGLKTKDATRLLRKTGLSNGSDSDWRDLVTLYNGNPLALELASKHINEVFFGDVSAFLSIGKPVFGQLHELLMWHFNRLSAREKEVLYWLAINREPITYGMLYNDLFSLSSKQLLATTLQLLQGKIPLEKQAFKFSLQPVLIEFITDYFIEKVVAEILEAFNDGERFINQLYYIHEFAIIKTSSSDYIRESQFRVLLDPIIERLLAKCTNNNHLINVLKQCICDLKKYSLGLKGYSIGNILNLLVRLKADLSNMDLSELNIAHAYLVWSNLQNVNMNNCSIVHTRFRESFGLILSCAFSPDGTQLATGSGNSNIQIWNVDEQKQIFELVGHSSWVVSLAFFRSGNSLVSGSNDRTARVWDVVSGNCIHTFVGFNASVRCVATSPCGNFIACGSEDQTIHIFSMTTGGCQNIFKLDYSVRSILYTPDGLRLIVGGSTSHLIVLSLTNMEDSISVSAHNDIIRTLAFNSSYTLLASGSSDKTIKVWDALTFDCVKTLVGHTDFVMVVRFTSDGMYLVSCSNDRTIRLWELQTGRCIKIFKGHTNWIRALDVSSRGDFIASGGDDLAIKLWNLDARQCVATFDSHTAPVWSFDVSKSGRYLVSGGDCLVLWDIHSHVPIVTSLGHMHRIWSVVFSNDGRFIASSGDDYTVRIWDWNLANCLMILTKHKRRIWSLAFNTDGKLLVSGGEDGVFVWETSSGKFLYSFQCDGDDDCVKTIALSHDIVATGNEDGKIRIFDLNTGRCENMIVGHSNYIWSLKFSPDGLSLASGSDDMSIKLWSVSSGDCIQSLYGHTGQIRGLAFNCDGTVLASGSADHTVKLWDVKTGKCLNTFYGHKDWVWSVQFAYNDNKVISCSQDERIVFWNIDENRIEFELKLSRPYEGLLISHVTGLSDAQVSSLCKLGALM